MLTTVFLTAMLTMAQLGQSSFVDIVIASFFTIAICYGMAKLMLYLFRVHAPTPQSEKQDGTMSIEEKYSHLNIPERPHLEICMDNRFSFSNQCDQNNDFDNEFASGRQFVFHRPTIDGVDGWCADYFHGKKRLWELRAHFKFKVRPDNLFFGIELEEYVPMNAAVKALQGMFVAACQKVADGVYHSPGDDPKTATGEVEKPICALPLWALDQFIVTPPGQEPPSLFDPKFPECGKKRYQRVSKYVKEIAELGRSFDTESTFSFSTWGVSRFLNIITWDLVGIPLFTPASFNKVCGKPPVNVVMYSLRPSADGKETRHLQSRKNYYLQAQVWSSLHRPENALEGLYRCDSLTGDASELVAGREARPSRGSQGIFSCCTARQ